MKDNIARPVALAVTFAVSAAIVATAVLGFIVFVAFGLAFVTWTAPAITLTGFLFVSRLSVIIGILVAALFMFSPEGNDVYKEVYKELVDEV
jgi:hypothetical protein